MASTFTDIGTELMTTGENAGTWGTKTNTNIQILERSISQEVKNSHHVSIFKTLRPHKNKTQKQNVSLRGTFFLFVRSSNAFFFFFSSSCIRSSKTSYYTPSVYSRERGAYHRIVRERPKSGSWKSFLQWRRPGAE